MEEIVMDMDAITSVVRWWEGWSWNFRTVPYDFDGERVIVPKWLVEIEWPDHYHMIEKWLGAASQIGEGVCASDLAHQYFLRIDSRCQRLMVEYAMSHPV